MGGEANQMKTAQDWSFITKEQGLPKLKPQENRIFHALTAAYSSGQQQEIFGASATIVQREKELCEMALGELMKVHNDGGKPDETLVLIQDHYQTRLRIASEKESKLRLLADDSRKLNEEHKKKNQELADVKRNLMESQTKLRDLAKQTEKLIKKEEELRFIEESLRTELDKNKHEMLNGLYEIVVELGESNAAQNLAKVIPIAAEDSLESRVETAMAYPETPAAKPSTYKPAPVLSPPDRSTLVASPPPEKIPAPAVTQPPLVAPVSAFIPRAPVKPQPQAALIDESSHLEKSAVKVGIKPNPNSTNDQATIVLASAPLSQNGTLITAPILHPQGNSLEGLIERVQKARAFEPLKALFSRSLVKTSEGEAICEYFYPVQSSKENRKYVFNALFTFQALLQVLKRDPTGFHSRLEMAAGDLLSRMDHGRNIALEDSLKADFTRDTLTKLLGLAWKPREQAFQELAHKVFSRLESLGAMRSKNLEDQFCRWPVS
jgi:hypothetical protein